MCQARIMIVYVDSFCTRFHTVYMGGGSALTGETVHSNVIRENIGELKNSSQETSSLKVTDRKVRLVHSKKRATRHRQNRIVVYYCNRFFDASIMPRDEII
jgi:hypothetical protein